MKIVVLGENGMLGHVVVRVLTEAGHEVLGNETRFDSSEPSAFIKNVLARRPDAVVNCVGLRPGIGISDNRMRDVNTLLPALVSEAIKGVGRFVHASSDAIYCSQKPARRSEEPGDATDSYGRDKWDAEVAVRASGALVIRASIIGPERGTQRSLMGWFLSKKETVSGYTNHVWNGITTLEWARLCDQLLTGDITKGTLFQPGIWPPVSKAELLNLIGEIWDAPIGIEPVEAAIAVQRSLVPDVLCPPIKHQLLDLKDWYQS